MSVSGSILHGALLLAVYALGKGLILALVSHSLKILLRSGAKELKKLQVLYWLLRSLFDFLPSYNVKKRFLFLYRTKIF